MLASLKQRASEDKTIESAIAILQSRARTGKIINSPEALIDYLKIVNHKKDKERFILISLDTRLRVLGCDVIAEGTVKSAFIDPRAVVEAALNRNATACFIGHNHPSGHLEPSQDDHNITKRLVNALGILDIQILDHIITADGMHYSFAEQGVMPSRHRSFKGGYA